MDFQRIQVDGFGTLADLHIDDLEPGLNVYHGPNGSGKTTLLHFLRGVVCGFEEARRLQLLPPLKGGSPGGNLTLADQGGGFTVVRRGRPDQSDALAIQVRQGTADEAEALRTRIEKLDRDLVHLLYFVGSYEAHAIDGLVHLALRDGVDLSTRRTDAAWVEPLTRDVAARRLDLWNGMDATRPIPQRESELQRAQHLAMQAARKQQLRQEAVVEELERLRMHRQRLEGEYGWLLAEVQPIEADLTECQTRLWSRRSRFVSDVQQIAQPLEQIAAGWIRELHEVDRQIEHAKQVLRDLATARLRLTLDSVGQACAETPDEATTLRQQRELLGRLEQHALASEIECGSRRTTLSRACDCATLVVNYERHLTDLRQTIYVLCQLVSRREAVVTRQHGLAEQARIDQCEGEVLERIRRLRDRREALLRSRQEPSASRVRHAVSHELLTCRCEGHAAFAAQLPVEAELVARPLREVITQREITESEARPTDPTAERSLLARRSELKRRTYELQGRIRDASLRIQELEAEQARFADDHSVIDLRFAEGQAEEQLTTVRDDWTALAFQGMILAEAQRRLHREEHSRVIAEASAYLQRLTLGRYTSFHFEPATRELSIRGADGQLLPPSALSRGTLDQAALSFRLALVAEYARRGVRLPLVLDDVLVDSDEGRLASAVEVLREVATQGQQVVFLTCQEHLSDLFDEHGFPVRMLTGGLRRASRPSPVRITPPSRTTVEVVASHSMVIESVATPRPLPVDSSITRHPSEPVVSPFPHIVENTDRDEATVRVRVQPEGPYWLRIDSPIGLLPSLGTQMERRLGTMGIGSLGDLILLDINTVGEELVSLQISPAQVRQWQAEARLLCCVPDLTGPEAQLLAAIGIQNPVELGAEDADALWRRIERARRQDSEAWQSWMSDRTDWPDVDRLRGWTRNGRRAMSLRAASQWAGWRPRRLQDLEQGDWDQWSPDRKRAEREPRAPRAFLGNERDGQPSERGERAPREDHSQRRRPRTEREPRSTDRSDSEHEATTRFYLEIDSPIVDAPSIGPKMAEKLAKLGILTVHDFLNRSADSIASRLDEARIDLQTIGTWQSQAALMCRVPGLRGHDAMLLIGCGVKTPDQLRSYSAEGLLSQVGPLAASREGQRMLRSASAPDLTEVTDWIRWASESRELRAA